jgi:hypothetical protein
MTKLLVCFFALVSLAAPASGAEVDMEASHIIWKGSKVVGADRVGQIFPKAASFELVNGAVKSG